MQNFQRPTRGISRARRILAPALAIVALTLTAQAALAVSRGAQPKPQLIVEAERSPQGAKLVFKGKGWTPNARIKISASRAPGSTNPQQFAMFERRQCGEPHRSQGECVQHRKHGGRPERFRDLYGHRFRHERKGYRQGVWWCVGLHVSVVS